MAEETDLYDEITTLMKPWRDEDREPPFSLGELTIMALFVSKEELDIHDIAAWIFSKFKYHQNQVFAVAWVHAYDEYGDWYGKDSTQGSFIDGLWDAVHEFDLPVEVNYPEDHEDAGDSSCYTFEISSTGTRQYLERLLPFRREGHFRFLSLPPELRNVIYGMMFAFPKSGLEVCKYSTTQEPVVRAMSRNYSDPFSYDIWHYGWRDLRISSPAELMGLVLVNKQISRETIPFFYQLNTFWLGRPDHGLDLYSALAPSRRNFLASLAIAHTPRCQTYTPEEVEVDTYFFQNLCGLKGLKKLYIEVDEVEWFKFSKKRGGGGQRFTAGNIPGFNHLLALADTVEVQLVGDCPTITANWKSETLKAVEAEAKSQERKLKRKKAPTVGIKQSTRATKARNTSLT